MLRMAAAALALLLASGAAAQAPSSTAPPGDTAVPERAWALAPPTGDVPADLALKTRYGGMVQDDLDPEGRTRRSRSTGGNRVAGYGDILLPLGRGWIPYAGADLSIVLRESDRGGDAIGLVVSPRVGLTWLVREYFSVDANVFMAWSAGEVSGANAQPDDQEHGLRLRLQIDF